MKLLVAGVLASLVLGSIAASAGAEERISLGKVKRSYRQALRDNCFDSCISKEFHYCKRISNRRAKCAGRVTWADQSGTNTCSLVNRYKQKAGEPVVYRITKHCDPV